MTARENFDQPILDLVSALANEIYKSNADPNRPTLQGGEIRFVDKQGEPSILIPIDELGRCDPPKRRVKVIENGVEVWRCL